MVIRWTEEEAISKGFRKDANGWWAKPEPKNGQKVFPSSFGGRLRNPHIDNSDEVSIDKRNVRDESGGEAKSEEGVKVVSKGCGRKFEITVTSFSRFHSDPDNLFPKYFIDELVRASLLDGDSSRNISWIKKQVVKVKSEEEERTEIVVNVVKENKS